MECQVKEKEASERRERLKTQVLKIEKYLKEHRYVKLGIMLLLGVIAYFMLGEWLALEDDSNSYIDSFVREGIMPVYPLFLLIFREILGLESYLHAVVAAQGLLAILCTLFFVTTLQKHIKCGELDSIIIYICCMLPYIVYLPEACMTHRIVTEGVAYSFFYLFFAFVLKTVWSLELKWLLASFFMMLVLALTRSQLILLAVAVGVLLFYVCVKKAPKGALQKTAAVIGGMLAALCLLLVSYKMVYGILNLYHQAVYKAYDLEQYHEEVVQIEDGEAKKVSKETETDSQVTTVIVARGFFEAEEEDIELFEDEIFRFVFQEAYRQAKEEKRLYTDAGTGLYMWQDLVYDRMIGYIKNGIELYDSQYPDMRQLTGNAIARQMGLKILVRHLDRYIYHTIRLMLPSFISAVFFQIEAIYLLCHFIALGIYLFAIAGSLFCWKRPGKRKIAEGMLATVAFIVILVGVTNAVFVGQQRYMVYAMGIFYGFAYLLFKELVCSIFDKK